MIHLIVSNGLIYKRNDLEKVEKSLLLIFLKEFRY